MTDGPYCAQCQTHRIQAHGQICPCCLDSQRRRHTPPEKPADTRRDTAPTANVDSRLSPERVTDIPASTEAQQ